jgi:hypothetical protein
MEVSAFYVYLHCHSAMKPFGKSFNKRKTTGINTANRRAKNSIWRYDPPTLPDKLLNYLTHLTKFSQANFTALGWGRMGIICASLYPLEKWFLRNNIKSEVFADVAGNFATGIGRKRVDYIQDIEDYFKDLEMQYDYYRQLNNKVIRLDDGKYTYRLTKNWSDILNNLSEAKEKNINIISVIFSMEGLHALNTGLQKEVNEQEVMDNAQKIKGWEVTKNF